MQYPIHLDPQGGHVEGGRVDITAYDGDEPAHARSDAELAELASLANRLMHHYGLRPDPWGDPEVPDAGKGRWTFAWDRGINRRGLTSYSARRISHSRVHAEHISVRSFVETVLHEIAHALVGPTHKHDEVWRSTAIAIGDTGNRLYEDRPAALMAATAPPFVGTCPNCKREVRKHRRSRVACRHCCDAHNYGHFDERFTLVWERAS